MHSEGLPHDAYQPPSTSLTICLKLYELFQMILSQHSDCGTPFGVQLSFWIPPGVITPSGWTTPGYLYETPSEFLLFALFGNNILLGHIIMPNRGNNLNKLMDRICLPIQRTKTRLIQTPYLPGPFCLQNAGSQARPLRAIHGGQSKYACLRT